MQHPKQRNTISTLMLSTMMQAALGAAMLAASLPVMAQAWQPDKNVEIVINTAPGSGQDSTGRLVQSILQERKLTGTASITINNKPGGGGAIAYTYLQAHPGNGHFVSIASKSLLTNHISGRAPLTYSHLTPLAILFDEYIAVAVKADSPIKNGREIIDRLKKDPGALSFGVATSLGNPNHQGIAMALKDAGIDLRKTKTPVFQSGGNAITALLGGHVDAVPGSVGLMRKFVEAGTVRIVAIASPQRLGGIFATAPTWKEQGAEGAQRARRDDRAGHRHGRRLHLSPRARAVPEARHDPGADRLLGQCAEAAHPDRRVEKGTGGQQLG